MCFEGMEENGSENLDKFIESEKDKFFAGVDCMCISGELTTSGHLQADKVDNYWLDTKTPCLTYGLRGVNYYEIRVSGPARDLHSGVFGGTVHEPMTDLVAVSELFGVSLTRTILMCSVQACHSGRSNSRYRDQGPHCASDQRRARQV